MALARSEEWAQLQQEEGSTEQLLLPEAARPWPVRMVSAVLLVGAFACVALGAGPGRGLLPVQMGGFISAEEDESNELAPRMMLKVTVEHDETAYTRTHEVDFAVEELTNDSVVIVDDGKTVYLWVGSDHGAQQNAEHAKVVAKEYAQYEGAIKGREVTVPEHMEDVKSAVEKVLAMPLMYKVTVSAPKKMLKVTVEHDETVYTRTQEVDFAVKELTKDSVVIVDVGERVYLWVGSDDGAQQNAEHAKDEAKEYAQYYGAIKGREVTASEDMEDVKSAVEKALATKGPVEEGKAVLTSVSLDKDNFDDSTAVFIVDSGKPGGVYLWLGKDASESVTGPAQDEANKKGGSHGVTVKGPGDEDKENEFGELFDQAEETDGSEDGDKPGEDDGEKKKNGSMPSGGSWSCLLLAIASILLTN